MRQNALIMLATILTVLGAPASAHTLFVAEVHSGCLIEFEGGFTVHLAGISVPDAKTRVGSQAHDFAKRRLEGQRVAVFTWTTDDTAAGIVYGADGLAFAKIMYGHALETDIAAELLHRGLAQVDLNNLPEGFANYLEIEAHAKNLKLGLWAEDATD